MTEHSKKTLEQYRESADLCLHCGACFARGPIVPHNWRELPPHEWDSPLHKCPSFEYYRFRAYTGQGRNILAALTFLDRIGVSDDLIHIAYTCTSCGICDKICPPQKPSYSVLALREELCERNAGLPEPLGRIDENIRRHHNIFGHKKRAESIKDLRLPARGEDVFFTGCYTSYVLPKSAKATVEILKAGGIDVAHLGEAERCCGEVPKQEGNRKLFAEMATHNVETMKQAGAKRVIVSCAHGYRTWKIDYPTVVGDLPFDVVHVSELFAELLEEDKIKFSKEIRKTVTYHDPCFLGHCGLYDPPRKLLNGIPGLELREMERYGKWAYCCGAGAKISLNCYPDFAAAIGRERVLEAKQVADHVVTACPVCFSQLRNAAKRENIEMEVCELSLVVAEAMGIEI